MLGAQRSLSYRERALEREERLASLAAGRAGITEMLQRSGDREVIWSKRALPNVEYPAPEFLGGLMTPERLSDTGETGENGSDFRMVFALAALHVQQTEQQWLRRDERRFLEIES